MGARGLAALVVLLLAAALLPSPASGFDRRILEGGKPSSGEDASAPSGAAGGSPKGDPPKESGHSSAAGQTSDSHRLQKSLPPAPSPPKKGTKVPSAGKGKEGGEVQASASASPPPPSPVKETDSHKTSPPPGGPGSNGEGGANGGTNPEDTGSQVKKEEMSKMKEVMEKCDASHKCSSGKEFSACLVSDNASLGSFVITVQNEGQNEINVTVKEPSSNIDIDKKPLHLANGAFGQVCNLVFYKICSRFHLIHGYYIL